jgi:phosphatidylglycerophosphate synthase
VAPSRHDENNRRPIPQRKWKISEMVTDALGRAGATPNGISLSSMVFGALAGILLAATSSAESEKLPWLCAGAALMIVGRLAANMFDGMVAFKFGGTTKIGELYNEVPDRISDTAILIGMGYAAGGTPVLGSVYYPQSL